MRLARAFLDTDKPEEAEKLARDALMIDIKNEEGRKAFLDALKAQGKADEAERAAKRFEAK